MRCVAEPAAMTGASARDAGGFGQDDEAREAAIPFCRHATRQAVISAHAILTRPFQLKSLYFRLGAYY